MFLSAQISYYPLEEDFKEPVREVIEKLEHSNIEVHPDRMSTQLFGDYDEVMKVINDAMKWSFENHGKSVFVATFHEGDRRPR
ncbi:YkoF family thiamine/hydroxymethylpyrimidine-binding protein [Marinobacter sp.]|uniref:YkoF family thiamine/hydroxymethylpyrimidine-binding protein n=1 Tax=Marinobacter sp. TaxID=50741 RepID=UPI00384C6868